MLLKVEKSGNMVLLSLMVGKRRGWGGIGERQIVERCLAIYLFLCC